MNSSERSALKLVVLPTGWGVPFVTSAPFSLKLLVWLRMMRIAHQVVIEPDTRKGPKQKSPWIEDGDLCMGDSELIISYLSRKHGIDPDAHLDSIGRALSLAWHRTFEEHYHQAFEHELFFGCGGRERLQEAVRPLPPIVRHFAASAISSKFRRQLKARGLGRHSPEEILAMGKADLDAASCFLADKPYFLGDKPSGLDACAFGFLGVSVYVKGDNPLFRHAASKRNLLEYCERIRARYFRETLP